MTKGQWKMSWSSCACLGGKQEKKLPKACLWGKCQLWREAQLSGDTWEQPLINHPHSRPVWEENLGLSLGGLLRVKMWSAACAEARRGKKVKSVCRAAVAGMAYGRQRDWLRSYWGQLCDRVRACHLSGQLRKHHHHHQQQQQQQKQKHVRFLSRRITCLGFHFRWGRRLGISERNDHIVKRIPYHVIWGTDEKTEKDFWL